MFEEGRTRWVQRVRIRAERALYLEHFAIAAIVLASWIVGLASWPG